MIKKLLLIILGLNLIFNANAQEVEQNPKDITLRLAEYLKEDKVSEMYSMFSSSLTDALPSSQIESLLTQLKSQYGALDSILKHIDDHRADAAYYRRGLKFGEQKFDLIISLDKSNLVNSIRISSYQDKRPWRKPPYVDLDKIQTSAIKIGDESPLNGEYSQSKANDTKTVVVMVHGSGPNNMNERLGPNEMFKDLAYGLASSGIGSIRYNKRSYEYASAMMREMNTITVQDIVVEDAILAIEKARSMGAERVVLLGHSLGGHLAPMIANKTKVDGVIVMAGNSSPLYSLIVPQLEHIQQNDPESQLNEFQINMVKGQVKMVEEGSYDENTPAAALPLSMPASFWLSLKDYDAAKTAKKQKVPYLILNGERDYQVTPQEAKLWKNGNKLSNSKTHIYPLLNHMFFAGEGVCIPSEYKQRGHLDEQVLSDIINWVNEL